MIVYLKDALKMYYSAYLSIAILVFCLNND